MRFHRMSSNLTTLCRIYSNNEDKSLLIACQLYLAINLIEIITSVSCIAQHLETFKMIVKCCMQESVLFNEQNDLEQDQV